jgi:hypothetical protein
MYTFLSGSHWQSDEEPCRESTWSLHEPRGSDILTWVLQRIVVGSADSLRHRKNLEEFSKPLFYFRLLYLCNLL